MSTKTFKSKHLPTSVIHEYKKPPKNKKITRKGCSSTRNPGSSSMVKQAKTIKSSKVFKNPEILKLAPYATSLISGKSALSKTNFSTAPSSTQAHTNGSCLKTIVERKKILKEMENLSEALVNQQKKFDLAVDRIKDERKKHKQQKKLIANGEQSKEHIKYLKKRIEDLKRNEENLLQDLMQQQSISKDALHGLDGLRVKFDEEKNVMKGELEHYYDILVQKEKEKHTNLLQRFGQLEGVQRQFNELEVKYMNIEKRHTEQRETMYSLQNMLEDSKATTKALEVKLEDKVAQLDVQEKEFKAVVGDLRSQLDVLGKTKFITHFR